VSQPIPITPPATGSLAVRDAIVRAAQATGADFGYLLAQAKLESSLDPAAQAGSSSAAGLYQFTKGTWLSTLDRHAASHGLDWADAAIEAGKVRDPVLRAQVLALRFDPETAALMAGELANDNHTALTTALGRAPDAAELYMAHFLGSAGASQFLSALAADPGQTAAALLPKAAAANRGIFFDGRGAPRSVGAVMALMRGKLERAMEPGGMADPAAGAVAAPALQLAGGPIAREFHAAAPSPIVTRPSMAETLRSSFGLSGEAGGTAATHVATAYARFKAFGL